MSIVRPPPQLTPDEQKLLREIQSVVRAQSYLWGCAEY
jgi:hypothetical protein